MWSLMGWHLADRRVWRFFLLSTVNGSILWPETRFRFCWLFNPLQLNKNQTVYNKSHFIHETFQSACLLGEYITLEIFIPTPFPSPTHTQTHAHACMHTPTTSLFFLNFLDDCFWFYQILCSFWQAKWENISKRTSKKNHLQEYRIWKLPNLMFLQMFFFLLFLFFFCGVHDETHCSVILAIRMTLNLIGISIQDHI